MSFNDDFLLQYRYVERINGLMYRLRYIFIEAQVVVLLIIS